MHANVQHYSAEEATYHEETECTNADQCLCTDYYHTRRKYLSAERSRQTQEAHLAFWAVPEKDENAAGD